MVTADTKEKKKRNEPLHELVESSLGAFLPLLEPETMRPIVMAASVPMTATNAFLYLLVEEGCSLSVLSRKGASSVGARGSSETRGAVKEKSARVRSKRFFFILRSPSEIL